MPSIKNVEDARVLLLGAASKLQDALDKNKTKSRSDKSWLHKLEVVATHINEAACLIDDEIADLQ